MKFCGLPKGVRVHFIRTCTPRLSWNATCNAVRSLNVAMYVPTPKEKNTRRGAPLVLYMSRLVGSKV